MIAEIPFVWVPAFAMVCYSFLSIALLSSQKNKQIMAFIKFLLGLLLWTLGSMFMRLGIGSDYRVWYRVSILALFLLPYLLYEFFFYFIDSKEHFRKSIWRIVTVIIFVLTLFDFFLPPPTRVLLRSGQKVFNYSMTYKTWIVIVVMVLQIADIIKMTFKSIRNNQASQEGTAPILLGAILILLGNVISILPGNVFPFDTLGGILNAILMFYALYKKRLFRLTLLVSRGVVVMETLLIVALFSTRFGGDIQRYLETVSPQISEFASLITAMILTGLIVTTYHTLKVLLGSLFLKEEQVQGERLKELSQVVSRSLDLQEILQFFVETIKDTITTKRVYVCLLDEQRKSYATAWTTTPLESKSFYIMADNPCVEWIKTNNKCMMIKDFERTSIYRTMWENEKKALRDLRVICMLPITCDGVLEGIVLLGEKEKNSNYTFDDITFLESAQSMISVAVKNAKLYQKAATEARTDHLTGLLNRKTFMEVLNDEYEKCRGYSLALVIFNLDDFKLFNQLYGASEGDLALQRIARIIKNSIGRNHIACRYGGKEFAVCLPKCDIREAMQLAENVQRQIQSIDTGQENITLKQLTFSCGICAVPYSATTLRELVENADMAVYSTKRSGKNKVLVYSKESKEEAKETESKLESNYEEYAPTIYALTAAIDAKDHYTFNHSQNVANYASQLAKAVGLNKDHVRVIYEAGLLHDIGKIAIAESILRKPDNLTNEEYNVMKTHVTHSISIIRHLPSLDYVIPSAIGHHERWDGKGYPRGISGEDIPIGARCLALADSFDAMVSKRSYKNKYSIDYAVSEIRKGAGTQFDPILAIRFVELIENGGIEVPQLNVTNLEQ